MRFDLQPDHTIRESVPERHGSTTVEQHVMLLIPEGCWLHEHWLEQAIRAWENGNFTEAITIVTWYCFQRPVAAKPKKVKQPKPVPAAAATQYRVNLGWTDETQRGERGKT